MSAGAALGQLTAWEPEPPLPDGSFRGEAVAIGAGEYDGSFNAPLVIEWSEPSDLVAPPGLTGTITVTACVVGGVIRSGDRLLDIDGLGRIAFHSNPPFYRPLQIGDVGSDVVELRRLVGASGSSPTFDDGVARAVASYNRSLGSNESERFDPATTIYLPADEVPVGRCAVREGDQINGGSVIASELARPLELSVSAPNDLSSLDGPWEVVVNGHAVPIDRSSTGTFINRDPGSLRTLELSPPEEAAASATPQEVDGEVRLAIPVPSATVPASTLFTRGSTTCLVLGRPDRFVVRQVVVLEARLGVVQVSAMPGDEPLSGTAVTNAPLVAVDRACPDG